MVPSPITAWQIDGETMKTVRGFIFLGFKITAASDCSREFIYLFIYLFAPMNLKDTCSLEENL